MARAAVVLAVLLLAGCAAEASGGTADAVVGEWELVSGTSSGAPIPQPEGGRATLTLDGADAAGTSFCNHYSSGYRIDGDAISFDGLGGTEMGCEPAVMEAEAVYLGALGEVDTVVVDGDQLRLTGDGVELSFRPVPPVPTSELVGTEWVLDTLLDDELASSVLAEPLLWLDPDGTVSGGTGCRSFSATWTVRGELVVFEDLVVEGHCTPELESQDLHVTAVLGDGFQVGIDGNLLTALDPDGRGLIYRDKG